MKLARLVALGTTALVFSSTIIAGPQEPTFRAESDLVSVYATVTGRDGKLVTTLTKDDFEVRDEGKPQPIVLFDDKPKPIRLIVLFDVSGSMEGNLRLLHDGARELFANLGPDDLARVGTFGKEVTISPTFTRNTSELMAALPTSIDPEALTALWRSVAQAMDELKDVGDARPVVLVLSDGGDSGARLGWGQRLVSQAEIIDRARNENVMLYAVAMRPRGRMAPGGFINVREALEDSQPDPGLSRAAEESGGGFTEINYNQNLGKAFTDIMTELHSQYLLGFTSARDGKVHDVDVRLKEGGMKVRARKSYRAPRDAR